MKKETTTTTQLVSIIDKAMNNPDVDIEKMTAILDMQERIMNKQAEMSFKAQGQSARGLGGNRARCRSHRR